MLREVSQACKGKDCVCSLKYRSKTQAKNSWPGYKNVFSRSGGDKVSETG